jgi:hypothetical protein
MQHASVRQASTAAFIAATSPPLLLLLALIGPASVLLLLCPLLLDPTACNTAAAPLTLLPLLDIAALNRSLRTVRLLLLHAASSCLAISAADRLQLCFTSCGHSCQT